jgi:hypothetical protein
MVPLGKRWHAYAWTLPEADFAFFDLRASSNVPVEEVVRHPIAFRVAVHKSAWTDGLWVRVGNVDPDAAEAARYRSRGVRPKVSVHGSRATSVPRGTDPRALAGGLGLVVE